MTNKAERLNPSLRANHPGDWPSGAGPAGLPTIKLGEGPNYWACAGEISEHTATRRAR